jgi:AraC-like DNA-binding protein
MMPVFYKPDPALSGLVNNIMISHITTEPSEKPLTFPFPPLPEHCIFFYPYDRPTNENMATGKLYQHPRCLVVGPNTERLSLTFGYNHLVIKIGFQPGGLYRLLGIPMEHMLKCKEFDGEDIFGREINDTIDALSDAESNVERKAITERFIFSRVNKAKKPASIDVVLPDILKYSGMMKIERLAQNACLSNRQFERAFKERIGLSPKFYSRLVRFAKAWLLKENSPAMSWTEIAYQCGYFDQMHLIRDFHAFAGTNPQTIATALETQPFSLNNRIFF